jgi:hypothetical protein
MPRPGSAKYDEPGSSVATKDALEVGKSKLSPDDVTELVEMHTGSFNGFRQTAEAWNRKHPDKTISHTTAMRRIKEVMEKAGKEQVASVSSMRVRQDGQLDVLIRIALGIAVSSRCVVCSGEKVIPVDRLDPSLGKEVCPKCEGSGRNENDDTRLRAVTTIKTLLERRAKLWGMDAPERIQHDAAISLVAMDVSQLDDRGLDELLGQHFGPGSLPALAPRSAEPPPGGDNGSSRQFAEPAPPVVDAEVVEDQEQPPPSSS